MLRALLLWHSAVSHLCLAFRKTEEAMYDSQRNASDERRDARSDLDEED